MSFNTEWDVDKYKTEYESEEHWQLRRCFMEIHKNKFPEERLVCLARVFTNIEFMGCRYPAETMELVAQLSQGVADGYREKQKTKLQRTFVKASDAAGAKVKGLKRLLGDASDTSDSPPKIPKCTDKIQVPQNNISSTSDILMCPGNIHLPQASISSTTETLEGVEKVLLLQTTTSTIATSECLEAKQLPQKTISSSTWEVVDKDTNIKNTSTASQVLKTPAFVQAVESAKKLSKQGIDQQENNDAEMNGCEEISNFTVNKDDCVLIEDAKSNSHNLKKDISEVDYDFQRLNKSPTGKVDPLEAGPYGNLVLYESKNFLSPFDVLAFSTSACNIPFKIQYSAELNSRCCKIVVNHLLVVSVSDQSKEIARQVATSCAVEKLKDVCYTLKVKKDPDDLVVTMATITSIQPSTSRGSHHAFLPKADDLNTPLSEDNIGSKLMRSMGWTGGGLGKTEQGIQEPVSVSLKVNRAGLGAQKKMAFETSFKAKAQFYLASYLKEDWPPNLLFKSTEFRGEKKNEIIKIARKLNLCFTSIGRRDFKISRNYSLHIIAAKMLRCGEFSNENYQLFPPRNPCQDHKPEYLQASDFPQHCCPVSSDDDREQFVHRSSETCVINGNPGEIPVKNKSKKGKRRRKDKFIRRAAQRAEIRLGNQRDNKSYALDAIAAGPYGNFFLIENVGENLKKSSVIFESAKLNCVPIEFKYGSSNTGAVCKVFVNNHLLTSSHGLTRRKAYYVAIEDAYNKLKQICYVLKVKTGIMSDDPVVERDQVNEYQPLEESIGIKLMRAMGWTKYQQGRQEPVRPSEYVKGAFLGFGKKMSNSQIKQKKEFRTIMCNMLADYKAKNEPHGLTFSSKFTKQERATIHQICGKLKLGSKSYGQGEDRKLVVTHKKEFREMVEQMLLSGEYSNSKYELVKPPITLPPEKENQEQPSCENNVKCEELVVSPTEPSTQVPQDQSPLAVTNVPRENISSVIVKPAEIAEKNVADEGSQGSTDGIAGPFGTLVLIEDETVITPIQLIERSANGCHIPFKFEYGNVGKGGMVCRLLINNILVASSTEVSKKRAREVTVNRSLVKLKDVCCTVKTQIKVIDGSLSIIKCLKKPNKRSIGYGKESESRIVCISKEVDWPSLGMEHGVKALSLVAFKDKVRHFLRKYQAESCPYDLIFSPEFSPHEKSWIQKIASGLALKITKYDISMKEYMVINKKLSSVELAKAMLTSGGNVSADSARLGNIFLL